MNSERKPDYVSLATGHLRGKKKNQNDSAELASVLRFKKAS